MKKELRRLVEKRLEHCLQEFCIPCRKITAALRGQFGENCTDGNIKFKSIQYECNKMTGVVSVEIDDQGYEINIVPLYQNLNWDGLDPQ